jgi:hypothetical protein
MSVNYLIQCASSTVLMVGLVQFLIIQLCIGFGQNGPELTPCLQITLSQYSNNEDAVRGYQSEVTPRHIAVKPSQILINAILIRNTPSSLLKLD